MNWPEQDLNPATTFGMLRGREEELGHAPDHVVTALTDLPSTQPHFAMENLRSMMLRSSALGSECRR